jgi:hypothetical protein
MNAITKRETDWFDTSQATPVHTGVYQTQAVRAALNSHWRGWDAEIQKWTHCCWGAAEADRAMQASKWSDDSMPGYWRGLAVKP